MAWSLHASGEAPDAGISAWRREPRIPAEVDVRHIGKTLPHQLLLEQVWGPEYVGDAQYLKIFIRRLRQKLGDDAEQPRYVRTQWGIGYRFVPPR